MARHVIGKRTLSQRSHLWNFLRPARQDRGLWHRSEAHHGNRRPAELLRIMRGCTG
jgi:hypothetical protein